MSLCKLSGENQSAEISLPYFVKTPENHLNKGQKQYNSESTEVEIALQMLCLPLYLRKTFALCQLKFEICQGNLTLSWFQPGM